MGIFQPDHGGPQEGGCLVTFGPSNGVQVGGDGLLPAGGAQTRRGPYDARQFGGDGHLLGFLGGGHFWEIPVDML